MTHVASPAATAYGRTVAARGGEIALREVSRLEGVIRRAHAALLPVQAARAPLDAALRRNLHASEDLAVRLDMLADTIVQAQRLVGMDSRASAILFLDEEKSARWHSYGDYRRHCDEYFERSVSRR